MAYLQNYEYDIFISYSHVDNKPDPGQTVGWIEQFYKYLSQMLDKRHGRSDIIKIWWDQMNIGGNMIFNQFIENSIKKSAIIICINSPCYAASDYCRKELDTFCKKTKKEKSGLIVDGRSRIINVLLNNIPPAEWLPELRGTVGFKFYNANKADDFGLTFGAFSNEFKLQMNSIRDAVWHLLEVLSKEQVSTPEPELTNEQDDDAFTIYIGEVSDTLRKPRKGIINELEKKGYKVVSGIPPPDEADAHEQATNNALKNAKLAVHLLDEYPGHKIVGEPNLWYTQKQVELAMQSSKSQMIWIPAETDFEDIKEEKYKLFLQNLESGKSTSKGFEFIRGSKSTLAQEIIDFAEQIKIQQLKKKQDNGKVHVLLDTHLKDQIYAFDLCKILCQNEIQPFLNAQEDDPLKNINLLGDRISQVSKLIFLYGYVSKEWIIQRMTKALQLIIENNYSVDYFYLYLAPPHKEADSIVLGQKLLKLSVFDNSNSQILNHESIGKFLTDLKTKDV